MENGNLHAVFAELGKDLGGIQKQLDRIEQNIAQPTEETGVLFRLAELRQTQGLYVVLNQLAPLHAGKYFTTARFKYIGDSKKQGMTEIPVPAELKGKTFVAYDENGILWCRNKPNEGAYPTIITGDTFWAGNFNRGENYIRFVVINDVPVARDIEPEVRF